MNRRQTIASSASLAIALGASSARADDSAKPAADGAAPDTRTHHPTGTFQIGAGYTTDNGFAVHTNLTQPHLFGTDNLLSLDTRFDERRWLSVLRWAHPNVLDSGTTVGAQLYFDVRELPGFQRTAIGGAVSLSHELGDHVVAFESYRIEHVSTDAPEVLFRGGADVSPPWNGGVIASLRAGLAFSTIDQAALPSRGSTAGIAVETATSWLGSSLELDKLDAWASTNQPFGPFTVHVATAFHAVSADAPRSERLYFTGSSEVRGFAPGTIAPVGGTIAAFGRLELEAPLVRRIGLAVEAFDDSGSFLVGNGWTIARSYGFGMIWRSPIGPLRFDWAYPLGGKPTFVFGAGALPFGL